MQKPVLVTLVLCAFGATAGALNGCASLLGDFEVDSTGSTDGGGGADADSAPPVQCTSTCTPEGATQCAMGKAQTCTKQANGCTAWTAPADCPMNQVCCTTKCAPVDNSNCFACGTACNGQTPKCQVLPKKCGCSVAICAASSQGCSPVTGACEACAPLPPGATDIFVDATGFRTGSGTEACPFPTITQALTKAEAIAASTITIHVAAGLYNTALGEQFPLTLRGKSITIRGEGADKTTIQGTGSVNHAADGGQLNATYDVTVLVGDPTAKHSISGITLRADNDAPTGNFYGVFCDRGNAPATVNPIPMPFTEPNLLLDKLNIGPGYDRGLVVSTSTSLSGCNAAVTGSNFAGNTNGIWAVGGGLSAAPLVTVALRVGGKLPGAGNTFKGMKAADTQSGTAIEAWDGVSPVLLYANTITDVNRGVAVVNHGRQDPGIPIPPYYEMEGNVVRNANNYGIGILETLVVEKFMNNEITGGTSEPGAGFPAVGLVFYTNTAGNAYWPVIKKARGNKIIGNEIGIDLGGPKQKPFEAQPDGLITDFGTAADPGNNVIACNSGPGGSAIIGYDLYVASKTLGSGEPPFLGNVWDHKPLIPLTAGAGPNGTDVLYNSGAPPALNFTNGSLRATACPAGRTP